MTNLIETRDRIRHQFGKTRWTYGVSVNSDDLMIALEALDNVIRWNDLYSRDCKERKLP